MTVNTFLKEDDHTKGDTLQGGVGATSRVCRLRIQHLGPRKHLAVRTNNNVEGWHYGLNWQASRRGQLPMYLLIHLLHREAKLTLLQIWLVSERKLRRIQWRKYRDLQQKIFELWDQFEANERSARWLLKACSHLNGPLEMWRQVNKVYQTKKMALLGATK